MSLTLSNNDNAPSDPAAERIARSIADGVYRLVLNYLAHPEHGARRSEGLYVDRGMVVRFAVEPRAAVGAGSCSGN
jgi:hypothetical protein